MLYPFPSNVRMVGEDSFTLLDNIFIMNFCSLAFKHKFALQYAFIWFTKMLSRTSLLVQVAGISSHAPGMNNTTSLTTMQMQVDQ